MEQRPTFSAQSAIGKLRLRDAVWLVPYSLRCLWELLHASFAFRTFAARDLPRNNATAHARGSITPETHQLHRMAYVIPRIARRLPWRSDCLIQAMAGQRWLTGDKIASDIQIGVQRAGSDGLAAHAWLVSHDIIVAGGDISRYEVLLESAPDNGF